MTEEAASVMAEPEMDSQSLSPRMAEPVLPAVGTFPEVAETIVEVVDTQLPPHEMVTQVAEIPAAQTAPGEDGQEQKPFESQVVVAASSQESKDTENQHGEDFQSILEWDAKCKKCWQPIMPQEAVVKAAKVLWCKECNTLYSMVKRHQAWPPPCFQGLSSEQQAAFWTKCKEDKGEKGFSYSRVRDLLVRTTTESKMQERRLDVGGTYLPLSVYRKRGYEISEGFEERNPRMWSDGLQDWVYMLAETSLHESEVKQSVEAEIASAERLVKKRKAVDDGKSEKESEKVEDASASTSKPMVLDLLTDSEGGELVGGECIYIDEVLILRPHGPPLSLF